MNQARTVLVLGGGVGGIVAANTLRSLLPTHDRIIVVDKEKYHLFSPSLLWVMIGDRKPEKITRPLERLERKGIEFVHGDIEKISPETKTIQVSGRNLSADALIIALGVEFGLSAIPGLPEAGHNLYSLKGATAIRDSLSNFQGGRVVILTAAPMYKCPAAPYEAAMLVEYACRRRNIRHKTQLDLYAAEPAPMGTAGPEVSAAVKHMVESKGIVYHSNHQVTRVNPNTREISFSNGKTVNYDLLITIPPHRVPQVILDSGLVAENGWVAVDRYTMETKFDSVFAIGDVTTIPLKMGKPLPKAGVFAHAQAEVVAHNLTWKWYQKGSVKTFDGWGECFIETGDHKAGIGSGNFYAEPTPKIDMKSPGIRWHLAKVLFEKHWLHRWF